MLESLTPTSTAEGSFNADLRGVHYDFLKDRLPAWFSDASVQRQVETGRHALQIPAWYRTSTAYQKKSLANSHSRFRESLNQIDAKLGRIKDVFEFAEQPLKDAIKATFNLDLDVKNVFLARKYAFKGRDDLYGAFAFEQQNTRDLNHEYRGTSLLEAALANFEPDEAKPLRCNDCQIITDWSRYDGDIIPTFEALNSQARPIAAHEFAALCRTLDLGALYQKHIKDIVQPEDQDERETLERQLEEHLRQQLAVTTEAAWQQLATRPGSRQVESGISADVYRMLQQTLTGSRATLDGRPVTCAALKVFGIELVGPLLIGPNRVSADRIERLAVYLPNDPEQPLKEYASSADFMADLRARLHSAAYRRFFSQFVPMRQQGLFFGHFNKLYKPDGAGNQADFPVQSRPTKLPLDEVLINGDLWLQLRQNAINKMYADARAVVVTTGEEDRKARASRLESYLDSVTNVFNLAAFVVPGLGPIMLMVGAAQMCNEVFEGIEAYEQGETKELWAHLSSVALNVAFVGTGAAVLPKIQLSSLVDSLKPVTLAEGEQKLWNPDLSTYKASVTLAPEARPDAVGLYPHNGQKVLPIEGDHYQVGHDAASDRYSIRHPNRPDAYSPELLHNGEGAWRHELERPQTWDATLMRRLGPIAEGFNDAELEQIRRVSGVDKDVLRRLHVEGEPVPAVLLETLKRFRAYDVALKVAQGIGEGSLSSALCGYAASLAVELPGWPASKAIEAVPGEGLSEPSVKYGNVDALPEDILKISREDLMSGQLPARIIASMNEAHIKALLPQYTPATSAERISTLKQKLHERAVSSRARLTHSLYAEQQPSADAQVATVQRDFTSLPAAMIKELLADATTAERATLNTDKRVPLRLGEGARRLQQQMRLTRAYEGLYLDALLDTDSEILVLNTLQHLPGWVSDIRLEVRERWLGGELRASVGPEDASERKVLLRTDDGRYEARNDRDEHLHGADDFYSSIQHALPDRQRQSIGVPDVAQGARLKAKILEHQMSPDQLRPLLKMQPRQPRFFKAPMRLSGERIGYPLSDQPDISRWERATEARLRALYPSMSAEEVGSFIENMDETLDGELKNREIEYAQMKVDLETWHRAWLRAASVEERSTRAFRRRRDARVTIIRALKQAWQCTGEVDVDSTGLRQGQRIDLAELDIGGEINELPTLTANFNHVTYLDLSGTGIKGNADGFLRNFERLRTLVLGNNELDALPQNLGSMTHLSTLDLSDNLIELDANAVAQLRKLKRVRYLGLEGNPLGMLPDIGRMPGLQIVLLANTGIDTWPVGLFDQARLRTLYLDMQANVLEIVPDVAPGSAQAEVIARTLISHEPANISAQNLQRVRHYGHSVGFEPNRPEYARGVADSGRWASGLTEEQWRGKQDLWADLENEPGSTPFFRELRNLSESADAVAADPAAKIGLSRKVWSMIEAATGNTALREKLFLMATAPTTCVDAGAQLFNAMGLEVLIVQAYELGTNELIETELVTLARGKSRLDRLGKIARERIRELMREGRQLIELDEDENLVPHFDAQGERLPDIDEVEIHMVYPTQLAATEFLDLPWQSREMRFSAPDVTAEMIQTAYDRVLAEEQGPRLQALLLEQEFWVDFVKRSYARRITVLRSRGEFLLDLQAAQRAWLGSDSTVHRIHWRAQVRRLARLLGKPESEIKPGTVLSDEQYYAEMAEIGTLETALIASLTEQAIARAKLQHGVGALGQNRK
ncbi:NEL-type E3 ubiquitin ligase domain-containing protein [Pseudomonas sp. GB2N2]